MVKIYSRKSCAPCATLKYWLSRKNVEYQEIDMDEVPNEYVMAPTVVIDDYVIVGLNLPLIAELLNAQKAS